MRKYNKNKIFKYIETYDNIMKIIKKMNLKAGDAIPSENSLQEMFNVSRGTVRQAIALLKEDGIIYTHQGKGNILIEIDEKKEISLVNIKDSIDKFNNIKYSKVEVTTEFQPASNKMREFLKKKDNFIVMLINVKYYIRDEIVALLMYFIDYENIKKYELNIDTEEEIKEFLDKYKKKYVKSSELTFQTFLSRSSVAKKMNIDIGKPLLYFSEVMKKENNQVSMYRRSYFDSKYFTFKLNRI